MARTRLYWTEPRQIGGADPVPLGSNNSGRGVGGSMVHYAGYTPRFHPSDFRTHTADGVGADWPIAYDDLKPFYEAIEQELPVAGQHWPWGDPHSLPAPRPPGRRQRRRLLAWRAGAAGIEARVGPVAIPNGRFGNRPHCIYRGFCLQGCKVNAKASPLITHIPDALAHGAEIRPDSMVTRVLVDDRTGTRTGVTYLRAGVEHYQRARAVAVAGYSIETPRLLLLSATDRFPDGLGNDYDQVGRYLMVQGAPQTAGRFDDEIRMYKAPPPEVSSRAVLRDRPDASRTDGAGRSRPSARCRSPGPSTWSRKATGARVARVHARLRALGHARRAVRVPAAADNRVTLADENDRHGLPVAHFSYSQCDNDKPLTGAATASMETILQRRRGHRDDDHPPLRPPRRRGPDGRTRRGRRGRRRITASSGCRTSTSSTAATLPTQGSANPALTIMALAARAADRLIRLGRRGLTEHQTELRHDYAPSPTSRRRRPRSIASRRPSPRPTAPCPGTPPPRSPSSLAAGGTSGWAGRTAARLRPRSSTTSGRCRP